MALRGVENIISDRVVAPAEQYSSCFTEQLALMPHTYMVELKASYTSSLRPHTLVA
jgi:hypothetical protein